MSIPETWRYSFIRNHSDERLKNNSMSLAKETIQACLQKVKGRVLREPDNSDLRREY